MAESQAFWSVEREQGQPDLFVCMSCLNEVFRLQVPAQGCPTCGAFTAYEAFALEDIQTWGTEELIRKAQRVSSPALSSSTPEAEVSDTPSLEESPS